MKTVAPITEQFQHLVRDLRESFWGDLYGQARGTLEKFLSRESVRLRDEAVGCERFQQKEERRGLSTRQVGRVVAILTDEVVSAQTVSKLTRSLDHLVRAFHQARLKDEWAYLFLDGVSLRVRRSGGRKRVQMLVVYGVRVDGSRRLAFLR